jgi:hypothetical protein
VLLDSASPDVRQVVALTMWHASKTEAGGQGLLGSLGHFLRLCKKHLSDDTHTRTALLQSFANIVRLCPADARGMLRSDAAEVVDMATGLLPALNLNADSDLQLMVDCATIVACLVELPTVRATNTTLETLLVLLLRVADVSDHSDDFLAWAVVHPIALLSAIDANQEPMYNEGFVAPLARLLDVKSERTTALILKTFTNLGFYGDVTLLVPGLTERLTAMTGSSELVADAAIVMFQSLQPTAAPASLAKSPTMSGGAAAEGGQTAVRRPSKLAQQRVLLCCMDDQQTFCLWLRDRLQQLGFTAMSPDLRSLTPAALHNLREVIDGASSVVVCVDTNMLASEVHRAFVGMCFVQKKQVIPVKLSAALRLSGSAFVCVCVCVLYVIWLMAFASFLPSTSCSHNVQGRTCSLPLSPPLSLSLSLSLFISLSHSLPHSLAGGWRSSLVTTTACSALNKSASGP